MAGGCVCKLAPAKEETVQLYQMLSESMAQNAVQQLETAITDFVVLVKTETSDPQALL